MSTTKMSKENIACCMVCQMTFSTHEELFVHSCAQIKAEKPEPEDDNQIEKDEKLLETLVQQDFKYNMDPKDFSESDSDYSPQKKTIKKEKQRRDTKVTKKKEKLKPKVKLKKKISKNVEYEADYPQQPDLALSNSNLQLSEDFIIFILKQVDELCENIKNGDPDVERVIEVHQGLNNVMSCYRNTLSPEKQIIIKSEAQEHYNLDEYTVLDPDNEQFEVAGSDNDYVPEVQQGKKKRGRSRNAVTDKTYELVKNQCGRHTLASMSFMLNINSATLKNRIKSDGLTFTEKKDSCKFCDMNKSIDNIDQDQLFLFMKYGTEKYKFGCILCDFTAIKRGNLFNHIKSMHESEITASKCKKFETKDDCGNSACKDLYGITKGKRFWCRKCTETPVLQKPKLEDKPRPKKPKKLCPECGISIQNLKTHLNNVHFGEKQICPHCAIELSCLRSLKEHVKKVHEKIPCAECGKMVGPQEMGRHMQSHLPDELKKYKCDICGKGFPTNQHFKNHRNMHTGEKPYKCIICNNGFTQRIRLNKHVAAVHEGKKPYLCTLCGKAWAERSNLKKHIDMVHKGIKRVMKKDKNHKCTICNASFYQNSALKLHIAGIHEGKKPYTCNLCGVSFAWKNNLTTHIDGVHRGIKKQYKKKIRVHI